MELNAYVFGAPLPKRTFLRVEHPSDRQGPYNSQASNADLRGVISRVWNATVYTHPNIIVDVSDKHGIGACLYEDYVCAVSSYVELWYWFDKEMFREMHKYGFFLAEYEVPDMERYTYFSTASGTQYMINKHSCNLIKLHSLEDYF